MRLASNPMMFVACRHVPSYMSSTNASFCGTSNDPGRESPSFQVPAVNSVFAINAFHRFTTGTLSLAPTSNAASAYSLVVLAKRDTLVYPLDWSLGHQRCSLIGGGAIKMIRGLWALIHGWLMIFSRLSLYSSSGTCCLFGAFGSDASLAPKKMV